LNLKPYGIFMKWQNWTGPIFPVCVKIGWLALGFLNLGFDRFQPRLVGVGMGGVKGIETICALFYGF
jgi:hypothetical protein